MKRDDDDVFFPSPAATSVETDDETVLLPAPGPSEEWTAQGVIQSLEPLTTEERRERMKEGLDNRIGAVTVLLDHPHDPHNGSAVMRSCDAFGIQRVHVVHTEDNFAASRMVAKGSQRWIDVIEHRSRARAISHLKETGHKILVTHPEGNLEAADLTRLDKIALVLGNERDGVGEPFYEAADDTIRIDMCGFVESLNMSVSAAILLYQATRNKSGDLSPTEKDNIFARWLRNSVPRADEVLSSFSPC